MNEDNSTTEQLDLITTSEPVGVELAPITRIGVETELSRYPIHHLAKRGGIAIDIQKVGPNGTVELRWEVNYNAKFGPPGPLAYKLDTLVINRQIDREMRPLPRVIKLGSMREVAAMLDLGNDTPKLRRALRQNVGAIISAKLKYKTADGGEKTLEADFSRYTAIFTGERLPDGQKADALYLILNDVYREVLNTAPIRPLNYDHLKSLPPAAQRFYEIISTRIYAALKHNNPYARILYSEFCTYSALTRHTDHENFRVQMAKIHQPHLKSGYIEKVHYEDQRDERGSVVDWMMCYKPGSRARAEHMTFARKSKRAAEASALAAPQSEIDITDYEVGESVSPISFPAPRRPREQKHPLHDELIKRGISETKTKKILASLREGQEMLDQLEYVDHLIAADPRKISSPAGFYVYFLTDNISVPLNFESSRRRKAREATEAAAQEQHLRRMEMETAYEQYKVSEVENYITDHILQTEIDEITKRKRSHIEETFKSFRVMNQSAQHSLLWGAVKAEIRPRVPLQSFEEFSKNQSAQMSLFLTPGVSSPDVRSEPKHQQAPIAPQLAQGEPKAPRKGQGSHPTKTAPLQAKFEATEVPIGTQPKAVLPVEQKLAATTPPIPATAGQGTAESSGGQLGIEDNVLTARYQAFRQKEARRHLDQLGMMERGRRLRALRVQMLNEHPDKDTFQHLIAEGEYEKFHELSEQHLIEVALEGLNLPSFEDWKRYALSVMGM